MHWFKIFLYLSILALKTSCFNIDTNHFIVYVDPQKTGNSSTSYFGYTVLLYPGNNNGYGKWAKIGAPRGQDPKIRRFNNTGVVYHCPLMEKCKPLDITKGYVEPGDLLHDAWIGGSMDISYEFQKIAICGYRQIYSYSPDVIGSCYWSNLKENFKEISPLKGKQRTYAINANTSIFYHALGETGFSTHFPEHEDAVILGAPGVWNWAGTFIKVFETNKPIPESRIVRHSTEFYIADPRPYDINSRFGLFGYAVTSGYYFGSNELFYAGSAPKYKVYNGKVSLFKFNQNQPLAERTTVIGNQLGEYFGASLTSGDLNQDGFDDLIVGAPYHAENTYNEGAVYIFLGGQGQFRKHDTVYGQKINGQFGSAVMFLGDINKDNFGDLAIGAPYEEELSGVLYIYKGNKEGIDSQPCQKIIGKQITPDIQGFGISISRPADIDQNGYKDLLVGAYLSGHAVLLRTNPILVVYYEMNTIPKELKQTTKSFLLNICYRYTQFYETGVVIGRTILVDEYLGRAAFKTTNKNTDTNTVKLKPYGITCENLTINLRKTKNYMAPITVSFSYKMGSQQSKTVVYISEKYKRGTDSFCVRCPELDPFRSTQPSTLSVPFSKDCGSDNICHSKLTIGAKFLDLETYNTFVVGSADYLNLQTIVINTGEHAYFTQLEITLPDIINFREIPAECTEQNVTVITCTIGNPLKQNTLKTQVLNLDMKRVNKNNDKLNVTISVKVMTTSNNSNPDKISLLLKLKREADITISGKSSQQSVPFGNVSNSMPDFTQIYQVQKIGASPLEKVQVNITIPHAIRKPCGDVDFIKVFPPVTLFAGQPIMCESNITYIKDSKSEEMTAKLDSDVSRRKRSPDLYENVVGKSNEGTVINGKELPITSNRTTYFVNCDMKDVVCSSIVCSVGPFEKEQILALIQLRMMFDPSVISDFLEEKDMVLYSTQGAVTIQIPPQFVQHGNRSDFVEVSSLLINEAERKKKIALWIIVLALIVGILLFALIVYGLTKVGFFRRQKKEELKNLKAATQQMIAAESNQNPFDPALTAPNEDLDIVEEDPVANTSSVVVTDNKIVYSSTEGLVDEDQKEIK